MKKTGLYIHIPFCIRKCNYCDFVSFSDKFGYVDNYFSHLFIELQYVIDQNKEISFDTVYIGGGTPSSVDSRYIKQIMSIICLLFLYHMQLFHWVFVFGHIVQPKLHHLLFLLFVNKV